MCDATSISVDDMEWSAGGTVEGTSEAELAKIVLVSADEQKERQGRQGQGQERAAGEGQACVHLLRIIGRHAQQ